MTTLTFANASAPNRSNPRRDERQHLGAPALLHVCLAYLAREYRIHRSLRAMMAFDDRMLRDIGLTRTEVESAARFGRALAD